MTCSTLNITPGTPVPGAVSNAETTVFRSTAVRTAFARASQPNYFAWLHHVQAAAGCTRPIRLTGDLLTVDTSTGQLLATVSTTDMPDNAIYKPCGNRRVSVCPSCSSRYQNDAYQLLHAGLVGGKGVPTSVNEHLTVFATFTAPSFGTVHNRVVRVHTCRSRRRCDCRAQPCHARRATDPTAGPCPHDRATVCFVRHETGDPLIGQPLCLDCYDYDAHVVWNLSAGELWRRTKQAIERHLGRIAKSRGLGIVIHLSGGRYRTISPVQVTHGKVGEFQARGAVHFHTLLRLDGVDPADPAEIIPPPAGITATDLDTAIRAAATQISFDTPVHPVTGQSWPINWGPQLDIQNIDYDNTGELTDRAVAGYLAKYATKATETTGHTSARITRANYTVFADEHTHTGRLIRACWRLSRNPTPLHHDVDENPYLRLENWAHMLGFGGHFLTKAPRYSVTFGALRAARTTYRRDHDRSHDEPGSSVHFHDDQVDNDDTVLVIGQLTYTGTGWHTLGDALLANTAAAAAREYAITAREELTQLYAADRSELVAA